MNGTGSQSCTSSMVHVLFSNALWLIISRISPLICVNLQAAGN